MRSGKMVRSRFVASCIAHCGSAATLHRRPSSAPVPRYTSHPLHISLYQEWTTLYFIHNNQLGTYTLLAIMYLHNTRLHVSKTSLLIRHNSTINYIAAHIQVLWSAPSEYNLQQNKPTAKLWLRVQSIML